MVRRRSQAPSAIQNLSLRPTYRGPGEKNSASIRGGVEDKGGVCRLMRMTHEGPKEDIDER